MSHKYLRPINVPDGRYKGLWSGHIIEFKLNDERIEVETDLGVRGLNIPVSFESKNNKIIESSITILPSTSSPWEN